MESLVSTSRFGLKYVRTGIIDSTNFRHDLEMPEKVPVPCGYGELDTFRKLLIVRSWVPDRTLLMAKTYVIGNLNSTHLRNPVKF